MGIGYGLRAFSGGLQTGMSMKMEKNKIDALKEEQKRQEKLAKQKETNAMNWYTTNENLLKTYHTQPQEKRNALLFESVQYSDDWHKTLRDFEDFMQAGDLEGAKHINDMLEEKLKIEGEMLELGVTAENGFMGSMFTKEKMDYVKKLRMGALSNKPIGTAMYEGEYGKLPAEQPKALTLEDKTNIITKHLSNKNYPAAKHFSKMWGIPISEKGELETEKTTAPTSFKTLQDIKDSFKYVKTKAEYNSALESYNASKEAKASDWTPPPFENQLVDYIKKVEEAIWADYINKDTGKLKDKNEWEKYNSHLQNYLKLIEEAKNTGVDVSQFQAFIPYKELYWGAGNPLLTKESW